MKLLANSKVFHSETSKSPGMSNAENSGPAPAPANTGPSLISQLQNISHAIANKNPVRVEMLTGLNVSKEVSRFFFK